MLVISIFVGKIMEMEERKFKFLLNFLGKIKLNFQYKKITEKMYYNLLEKYNISLFLILTLCKAFSNFGFNLTIRKKIHWVVLLF